MSETVTDPKAAPGLRVTEPSPEVLEARAGIEAARANLDEELVRLEASFRAAIDIPAKIRKQPVKAAGLAAGAGFIAFGGPKKVFKGAKRAIFGPGKPLPKSMLPKEIDESLGRLGEDGDKVRGLLEREFAEYLRTSESARNKRDLGRASVLLTVAALRPLVLGYSKKLANEILATDGQEYRVRMAQVRSRLAEKQGGAKAPAASGPAAGASSAPATPPAPPAPAAPKKDSSTGW